MCGINIWRGFPGLNNHTEAGRKFVLQTATVRCCKKSDCNIKSITFFLLDSTRLDSTRNWSFLLDISYSYLLVSYLCTNIASPWCLVSFRFLHSPSNIENVEYRSECRFYGACNRRLTLSGWAEEGKTKTTCKYLTEWCLSCEWVMKVEDFRKELKTFRDNHNSRIVDREEFWKPTGGALEECESNVEIDSNFGFWCHREWLTIEQHSQPHSHGRALKLSCWALIVLVLFKPHNLGELHSAWQPKIVEGSILAQQTVELNRNWVMVVFISSTMWFELHPTMLWQNEIQHQAFNSNCLKFVAESSLAMNTPNSTVDSINNQFNLIPFRLHRRDQLTFMSSKKINGKSN